MYIRGIVLKLMRKINDLFYTIQASSAFSSRTVNYIFIWHTNLVREFKTWGAIFHMFINLCVPVSGQQRNKDSLTQNMLKGILKELIISSFVTD